MAHNRENVTILDVRLWTAMPGEIDRCSAILKMGLMV
jgi:hypothetical protein